MAILLNIAPVNPGEFAGGAQQRYPVSHRSVKVDSN
jgi:hypothetical protein